MNDSAYASIRGVKYPLIPRTVSVQKRIDEVALLSENFENGILSYNEAIEKQVKFIEDISGCRVFSALSPETIDLDELASACIAIINGYKRKVNAAKLESLGFDIPARPEKKKKKK